MNNIKNARLRKNVFMWQTVLNCAETWTVKYHIIEKNKAHDHIVSSLPFKGDDLDHAIVFAVNQRRHEHTIIEIFEDGKVVASQDRIDGQWIKL